MTSWPYDPLLFGVDLSLRIRHHPLGYPVELATNSPDVLLAAGESWAGFPQFFSDRPLEIRVVAEDVPGAECAAGLTIRGRGRWITMVSDASNFAVCDAESGACTCWITTATARDRAWFRYFYLDTMVRMTLWQTHLTRIHAGCVALDGRGVLFAGPSGAGKSCLTYACARRGWTFVSDEAPSIVRRCQERIVIGTPHAIHLREGAFDLFPELRGRTVNPDPVGKISFEVRTAELPRVTAAHRSRIDAIVFLDRRDEAAAQLVPLARQEAWERLSADLPYFDEPAHSENLAALRNIVGANVYQLRYSGIDAAIDEMERVLRKGGEV